VAVKIKLKRMGKIRAPQYRIVVADSRTKRDGRAIEEIGIYQPMEDPSLIRVDSERVQYWLGVGAQPTEPVQAILKVTGDWQKFKGLPGAEGTLRTAEPKKDKKTVFEAAVKDATAEPKSEATTPKSRAKKAAAKAPAAEAPAESAPAAEAPAAEAPAESAPAAEAPAAEAPAAEAPAESAPAESAPAKTAATDAAAESAEATPAEATSEA
jgi:small subunit ribosomal protein S16